MAQCDAAQCGSGGRDIVEALLSSQIPLERVQVRARATNP